MLDSSDRANGAKPLLAAAGAIPASPDRAMAIPAHGYRADIDGLRAIAVLPVVMFHAGLGFPGGFTGVDVFFVISGFLITSLIAAEMAERRFSILGFYERRIRRIFPALFAVFAAGGVAAWLLFMPPEFSLFGNSMALAALFSSNIGFWLEAGYFDMSAQFKPLLHTWSLAVEEQFYVVFPLLLAALGRFLPKSRTAIIAVLTLSSFIAGAVWAAREPAGAFFLLPARFWELGIGSLLALSPSLWPRLSRFAAGFAAVGLALIAMGMFAISESTPFPGAAALLPCIGTALVIAAGFSANPISAMLGWWPIVFVGLISYSLYLWHWPIIVFAQYKLGHLLTVREALIVVAASMAIAAVSWRFVEQPVRRRKLFGERRALFGGAATLVAAAVAFGVSIPAMSGWPGRLTVAVQNILAVKSDADRFGTHKCMTEARDTRVNSDAVRQGKLCVMGSPGDGAPEFLVWGDSHAAAMAPAIDSAAARSRKRGLFVGRGGCPPLVDYDSMSLHRSRREACRERNDAVIDLVRNAKIPLVFLVGRWPREVLGAENGLEGPFYDPSAAYAIEDRSVQVAKALDATIAALAGLGARAVLVMDVPEPGYDVPVALARAQISKTAVNVNLARDAVRARQDPALKVLRQAAEKWGLAIIDPTPAFCDSRICRTEAAGVPLYRDADHISRTMALAISYLFDESFAASLPAR